MHVAGYYHTAMALQTGQQQLSQKPQEIMQIGLQMLSTAPTLQYVQCKAPQTSGLTYDHARHDMLTVNKHSQSRAAKLALQP